MVHPKCLPKKLSWNGTERARTRLLFYSKRYIVVHCDGHHTTDVLNYIFVIYMWIFIVVQGIAEMKTLLYCS